MPFPIIASSKCRLSIEVVATAWLLFACRSAFAGSPERIAEPIEFRAKEFQLSVFGFGGVGDNVERVTEERIETTNRTILETKSVIRLVSVVVYKPFFFGNGSIGYRPVVKTKLKEIVITTPHEVTETHKIRRPKDVTYLQGFGGAGVDAKYFLTRNLGLGLAGEWASGGSDFGTLKATVTARFPMGSNAPYLYGGAGAMFSGETKAIGVLGIGFEHRFTSRSGAFADAGWMFSDEENSAVFRVGFSFIR